MFELYLPLSTILNLYRCAFSTFQPGLLFSSANTWCKEHTFAFCDMRSSWLFALLDGREGWLISRVLPGRVIRSPAAAAVIQAFFEFRVSAQHLCLIVRVLRVHSIIGVAKWKTFLCFILQVGITTGLFSVPQLITHTFRQLLSHRAAQPRTGRTGTVTL